MTKQNHVYVKICGNTNYEDALCAVEAGAELLGFIFYPPSPRSIRAKDAADVIARLRQHKKAASVKMVGVFVNETVEIMMQTLQDVHLDYAQLSGNESVATVLSISKQSFKVLRTKNLPEWVDFISRKDYTDDEVAKPDYLLDADHDQLYGGSGVRADESLAAQLARQCKLILAGGLTPNNVADAIRKVRPWGVDVASGTEAQPGKKDHAKVRSFVQAVRSVSLKDN